jgi:acyl-CoA thioesterase
VTRIRDGAGYVQRRIDASQPDDRGIIFTAVASFKRREARVHLRARDARTTALRRYAATGVRGLDDDDHDPATSWPEAPGIDSPYWWEVERERGAVDRFPGLEMRKVDMQAWNVGRTALDKRQLMFYRVIGSVPGVGVDANLHAAAHLYASDRNGLFTVSFFLFLFGHARTDEKDCEFPRGRQQL